MDSVFELVDDEVIELVSPSRVHASQDEPVEELVSEEVPHVDDELEVLDEEVEVLAPWITAGSQQVQVLLLCAPCGLLRCAWPSPHLWALLRS